MAWYRVSADELEHTQEEYHKKKIEPGERAYDMVRATIRTCLRRLGVTNPDNMDEIRALGYIIEDCDTEQAMKICKILGKEYQPQIQGWYIAKVNEAYMMAKSGIPVPPATIEYSLMYFISDAYLDSEGRVTIDLYDAQAERLVEQTGVKIS